MDNRERALREALVQLAARWRLDGDCLGPSDCAEDVEKLLGEARAAIEGEPAPRYKAGFYYALEYLKQGEYFNAKKTLEEALQADGPAVTREGALEPQVMAGFVIGHILNFYQGKDAKDFRHAFRRNAMPIIVEALERAAQGASEKGREAQDTFKLSRRVAADYMKHAAGEDGDCELEAEECLADFLHRALTEPPQ